MKIKELLTVLDSKAYLNIESEKGQWLYEGNVIFIPSDLLERTIKLVDSIRNEFFITLED
jgi:hypothetical protein